MGNASLAIWRRTGLVATVVIVLSVPAYLLKAGYERKPAPPPVVRFVGSEKCERCHKEAYGKWKNSHHDLAMDVATDNTVLGNFDNAVIRHNGIETRFFRKKGKFYVHTRGPEGKMGVFEIAYTFGAFPLQQYLIPFPGGRLQCLTIAWDVKAKKWFLLPNHTDDTSDWLHWTRGGENWNLMCAECHSTNLAKRYDMATDAYKTTWTDIDVGCEACHGPGERHVAWADRPAMGLTETENFDLTVDTRELDAAGMLGICAPCHSRRSFLGGPIPVSGEVMDGMIPQVLETGMYYPDGQILEEVYVYGSFVQSRMYRRGVRCSDCHDIHSLKLHKEKNDLCLACHRADTYDTKDHHFHKKLDKGKPSEGWLCVRCHMPGRYYMGNDFRIDHSIRVPRPDLSQELGTPNSCNAAGCHADKAVAWSVGHYRKWYGTKRKPHYGQVIAAGRARRPGAGAELILLADDRLMPGIARATALSLLRGDRSEEARQAFSRALADDDPLVRFHAVRNFPAGPPEEQVRFLGPLLFDPVKAVRIEAAQSLSAVPADLLAPDRKQAFDVALDEYVRAMEYSADFATSRHNLGILYTNLGQPDRARENYEAAIAIDDLFYPAKVNLAVLYSQMGRNQDAETLLRSVLKIRPDYPEVAYSLGLLLAEEKRYGEAVEYLRAAARGMPGRSRAHYNLGLLLQHMGKGPEAERSLLKALELEPRNLDYLYAAADHYVKAGRFGEARKIAERMIAAHPSQRIGHDLLEYLNGQYSRSTRK
jgi:Tfp pilus assembly protein PilF